MGIESMHHAGPTIDDRAIDDLERSLGVTLPADYRAFLLRYNGGTPVPTDFPISPRGGSLVGSLYGITVRPTFDIATRTKRLADRIPPNTIVVGIDAGGNWITLGVSGPGAGKVYFVDHEGLEGQPIEERTRPIAGSWTEFLDGLGTSPSRRR